jgi:hypothetical protein
MAVVACFEAIGLVAVVFMFLGRWGHDVGSRGDLVVSGRLPHTACSGCPHGLSLTSATDILANTSVGATVSYGLLTVPNIGESVIADVLH